MDENKIVMEKAEFEKMLKDRLEVELRNLKLDKAEKKEGIFTDEKVDALLEAREKMAKFVTAVVYNKPEELKALSEGTDADGGYLVPTEYSSIFLAKLATVSKFRKYATVLPMGRDKMTVPADANAVTVYWVGENADVTESNPTFGSVTLDTNKLMGLSRMSRELFADSSISLIDRLTVIFTNAFNKEENKVFMAGDGSGKPKGVRAYTITDIAQAGSSLVADDIENLYFSLPEGYRENPGTVWLMHGNTIKKVNALRTTAGAKLYPELLDKGVLLGKPVLEMPDIPTNLGTGTNESEVFFGDLGAYLIGDREQIGVENTTVGEGAFKAHQNVFKMWERVDGKLGVTDAFRKLTGVK